MAEAAKNPNADSPAIAQGFRARVEPIWLSLDTNRAEMGFPRYLLRRMSLGRQIARIRRRLDEFEDDDSKWFRRKGQAVCEIQIAKLGFVQEIRDFVREHLEPEAQGKVLHFLQSRDWNAYYVPVDFPKPFSVAGGGKERIPVGSSIQLLQELLVLDGLFDCKKKLGSKQLGAFVRITEEEMARFNEEHEDFPHFWHFFGIVLLIKLAEESIRHDLPIVFG